MDKTLSGLQLLIFLHDKQKSEQFAKHPKHGPHFVTERTKLYHCTKQQTKTGEPDKALITHKLRKNF